jgi:hypothetical protein
MVSIYKINLNEIRRHELRFYQAVQSSQNELNVNGDLLSTTYISLSQLAKLQMPIRTNCKRKANTKWYNNYKRYLHGINLNRSE